MGLVYRAVDIALDRVVALKIIVPQLSADPVAVARFKSEAKLAASLDHPNLVTIYSAGECDGVLFLAMQFVTGTSLEPIIIKGPLELQRVRRIIRQVASALDVTHTACLVHRDVKPANILVTRAVPDEHVYLTDFGITKRFLAATSGPTRSGQWVGTPQYAAPEQVTGTGVDPRTDVYSLGCVLFELLTGSPPYERDETVATIWAHLNEPPPAPCAYRPGLLPVFDSVVAHATAKEPDDRFSSAGALADALDKAVNLQLVSERAGDERTTVPAVHDGRSLSVTAAPENVGARSGVQTRRRLPVVLAVALLVVAAVALGVGLLASSGSPRRRRPAPPSSLKADVARLDSIVQLFIAGKTLSHADQRYEAAAGNRRRVLARLTAFHAPPQLRPAADTLRQMTQDSLRFNADMARGDASRARGPDNAHNALRGRFVNQFNPLGHRYLGRTYTIGQL
jgi:Protein kinase domain